MPVNLFLPQVTRIPIAGPAPYNTLVCVAAETGAGPQQVNAGNTSRWSVTVPTPFRLAGFDQRVPPQFDHSTAAFMSATGPAQDSQFQYAVDSVTDAGFDPVEGTYFVKINVALEPPDPQASTCLSLGEFGICFYLLLIQVCSFVLVYEPPVAAQPAGTGSGRAAVLPRISLGPASSLAELLSQKLGLPVSMPSRAAIVGGQKKHCDSPRCRKKAALKGHASSGLPDKVARR